MVASDAVDAAEVCTVRLHCSHASPSELTLRVRVLQPCIELPSVLLLHARSNLREDGTSSALPAALDGLAAHGASDLTLLCLRLAVERANGPLS